MRTVSPLFRQTFPRLTFGCLALILACADRPDDPVGPPASAAVLGAAPGVALKQGGAGAKAKGKGAKLLPVKGRLTGTVNSIRISESEQLYRLEASAEGPVSHLGRTQASIVVPELTYDPATLRLTPLRTTWTGTLTAANGDQVFGTYTLRSAVVAANLLGGFQVTADLAVTDGTGRFAGATGTGVAVVRGNIFTERVTIEFTATGAFASGP